MKITVRLLMTLQKFAPDQKRSAPFELSVPDGSTVNDVIRHIGIPEEISLIPLKAGFALKREEILHENDEIHFLPPVAGGEA